MSRTTTWKKELEEVLRENGDEIIFATLTDEEINREFDAGFGRAEGDPFTAWSVDFVYFPASYDGMEWIARVPRHPSEIKTEHIGGR